MPEEECKECNGDGLRYPLFSRRPVYCDCYSGTLLKLRDLPKKIKKENKKKKR